MFRIRAALTMKVRSYLFIAGSDLWVEKKLIFNEKFQLSNQTEIKTHLSTILLISKLNILN